jgi:hypothetical protein
MQKLLGIVLAVILVLALSAPALAITTGATVGGGEGTAYMIALFATPDDEPGSTSETNVLPEFVTPDGVAPLWDALDPASDGWKRMKFYVIANNLQGRTTISVA